MVLVILVLLAPFFAAEPQSFESAYKAGLVALFHDDLTAAQSNLEAAAKLQPSNGRVWAALADLNLKLNRRDEADRLAKKAEALAPDDPLVAKALAIFYSQTDRPLPAAELEVKYAAANPSDNGALQQAAAWYFAASQPLLARQKFAEALAILEPAASKIPSDPQLQLALGVADYGLRRFDEAASRFLKTIEIDPELRQPYDFLGRILDQTPGEVSQVRDKAAAYRTAHPDAELGYLLEARSLDAMSAEPGRARELLLKAVELAPSDAAAHAELGILDERTQRLPDAAAEFERAASLDPSDAVPHYHLARIYDRLGQHDRARVEREAHAKLIARQEAVR